MPSRPRRRPRPELPPTSVVGHRIINAADVLRHLADEFERFPFDTHICQLGPDAEPELIIPVDHPGIIEDFRARARAMDGAGSN